MKELFMDSVFFGVLISLGSYFFRRMAEGEDPVVPDESAVDIDNFGDRHTSLCRSEL